MRRQNTAVDFWANVEKTATCWLWKGKPSKQGYGTVRFQGRTWGAHTLAWTLTHGPIPKGKEPDHICRNRLCVRPELPHLELVTHQVNVLRGIGPTAANAKKTHCKRGHEFSPENTYQTPDGKGCRICRRAYIRDWMRRKRHPQCSLAIRRQG